VAYATTKIQNYVIKTLLMVATNFHALGRHIIVMRVSLLYRKMVCPFYLSDIRHGIPAARQSKYLPASYCRVKNDTIHP
jgi:hypothetical protein